MAASSKSRIASTIGYSAEARSAEAAKIARLRALRLAKEADDQEAERTAIATSAKPTRRRRTTSAGPPDRSSEDG
jgi:hypothetical protein